MGDSSYLNFSSPVGHLSGLDAKTITWKSTWLLFAGHRNPTVVSGTELRCRHLFSGLVVELERNLRGREGPPLPPQAPRRQNLKMNRVVLCPPPRVYTLYHPATPECRVGVSKCVGHFPAGGGRLAFLERVTLLPGRLQSG